MLAALFRALVAPGKAGGIEIGGRRMNQATLLKNLLAALFPLILCVVTLWGIWWYVVIHPVADVEPTKPVVAAAQKQAAPAIQPEKDATQEEKAQELGTGLSVTEAPAAQKEAESLQEMGNPDLLKQGAASPSEAGPPPEFYTYFWIIVAATALVLLWYYWKMEAEQFELLKLLISSVMPLGILTIVVLAVIIFGLGWPLEWTEIIVIFVPIFLPLLKHFNIDPILWGTLVFVNLQAAFLSPPVAMSAFYLKGVSPPHVTLNQIFAGMMPYMLVVILCMVIMYLWPGMTLWLPGYLYGG